ncbi:MULTISPECIES: class I SAM-dependent methyltransferase [unclassified Acinetobacter]|uniref:class I SAM-dependent methyltransferase n=1 Tax=unclassified Acinetobacter TaxID=196816 RepID=UPI002934EFF1|nr:MULTISPECIES: class I SAM-dependent methyltransferase [unclassified Acinetobacter]WOE31039.1 class I SAM-dependent methyltransferase [Acinetobacter sp. SAAs470]WOE39235.1 class I SAM-dependent methyltransferase [Acinetobacter sp. SAAs474]
MKDLFSVQSQLYQSARPSYPAYVLQAILPYVTQHQRAWDCAAGSGQFTRLLSPYFDQVIATDLSAQQLAHAPNLPNVDYRVQAVEKTVFPAQYFNLITVAQAIHWFNFDLFYQTAQRCLTSDGVIAVIGYGLLTVDDDEIHDMVQKLYHHILNGYWDIERRYLDEEYKTIPFPFKEILLPQLHMTYSWSLSQLLDYLNTWSAIRHYRQQHQQDPLQDFLEKLQYADPMLQISFPIFLRLGMKQ